MAPSSMMPMTITLEKIEQSASIEDPVLRQKAQDVAVGKHTLLYRAISSGREVAFVAIDWRFDLDCLVLYELFVPRALRRRGFGSAVLSEVERIAAFNGITAVRLFAASLDPTISLQHLVRWYLERGYQVDQAIPAEMKKMVSRRLDQSDGTFPAGTPQHSRNSR